MTTLRSLVTSSLRLINAIQAGQAPAQNDMEVGVEALNALIDSWSSERLNIYTISPHYFQLEAGKKDYTLGPDGDFDLQRPLNIEQAYVTPDLLLPAPAPGPAPAPAPAPGPSQHFAWDAQSGNITSTPEGTTVETNFEFSPSVDHGAHWHVIDPTFGDSTTTFTPESMVDIGFPDDIIELRLEPDFTVDFGSRCTLKIVDENGTGWSVETGSGFTIYPRQVTVTRWVEGSGTQVLLFDGELGAPGATGAEGDGPPYNGDTYLRVVITSTMVNLYVNDGFVREEPFTSTLVGFVVDNVRMSGARNAPGQQDEESVIWSASINSVVGG